MNDSGRMRMALACLVCLTYKSLLLILPNYKLTSKEAEYLKILYDMSFSFLICKNVVNYWSRNKRSY